MKNVRYFIVGLGMIGASYAKKLAKAGYLVYGHDIDEKTNKIALKKGYIKDYGLDFLPNSDVVILTLYPKANVEFVKKNINRFDSVKFVTDVAGIKEKNTDEIAFLLKDKTVYLSHHPMAGSEKSGIMAANENVFKNANFLIIGNKESQGIEYLLDLFRNLNFGRVSIIDQSTHDLMISFTSQLPHLIAVGLVNSDIYENTKDFSGDSFKDLTRIANINVELWSELFFSNKDYLLNDMKRFKVELEKLIAALEKNDEKELKKLLTTAKEKRNSYEKTNH